MSLNINPVRKLNRTAVASFPLLRRVGGSRVRETPLLFAARDQGEGEDKYKTMRPAGRDPSIRQ